MTVSCQRLYRTVSKIPRNVPAPQVHTNKCTSIPDAELLSKHRVKAGHWSPAVSGAEQGTLGRFPELVLARLRTHLAFSGNLQF